MKSCTFHSDSPGIPSYDIGLLTLQEILCHVFGILNYATCRKCAVVLSLILGCKPDLGEEYSEIPSDAIMVSFVIFDQLSLQRINIYNQIPFETGKVRRKIFSFDIIQRPSATLHYVEGNSTSEQKATELVHSSPLLREIIWADRSRLWDVLEDSTTQAAFDRAAEWLAYCIEHDEPCKPPDRNFVPRRLLNVRRNDGASEPFLFEPTNPTAYACLSYCWGEDVGDVLKTTTSNLDSHYKEVPLRSMPKSLQDAVTLCRGLNISYLWVDSICIVQDDYDSWLQDASMMDQIYLNSQVTISALEPSSCKAGFLGKQKFGHPEWQQILKLPDTEDEYIARQNIGNTVEQSLDKRGWCLQETLLPYRRLCFDGNEMSWECSCRKVCECGHCIWPRFGSMEENYEFNAAQLGSLLKGIALQSTTKKITEFYSLGVSDRHIQWLTGKQSADHIKGAPEKIYDLWRRVVSNYSRRALSRQSDKLAALVGLSNIMRKSTQKDTNTRDDYIAGLWKEELHFDLTWRVAAYKPRSNLSTNERSSAPDQRQYFPSWSWASREGVITYYDYIAPMLDWDGSFPFGLGVIDKCLVKGIKGIAEDGTPTAEGGCLSLEGGLVAVELTIFGEYLGPDSRFTPIQEADVYPFPLGVPRNDRPKTSAFVRPRTLYSARAYLDEPVDPTIKEDDAQAPCWIEGQCKEHCCSWNQGQDKTEYYCFKLFSWNFDPLEDDPHREVGGPANPKTETWFLILRSSRLVKGAFERIGVGAWARERKQGQDLGEMDPFGAAKVETINII
ncbi:HET-domain-containing protein [Daldinia sp. FL1419]|nr:HET-domain-containing protein [Daldinia sp. FL1419]